MPTLTEAAFHRLTGLKPFPEPPVLPLRHPVVLMHGFGLFASFRRGGHLHEEALHLRARGVRAYAPNVPPYSTISTRTRRWDARLHHVLKETKAEKLHLIAHSMGGLDARYLISKMGWHAHVLTLTTVSTPHHGSAAAAFVLEQPERLREGLAEIFDWMGTHALREDTTADFLQALRELTPDHVQEQFNPAVPDHPDVQYRSYAGRAGKGTGVPINPLFRFLNRAIYEQEGENDGFVSVKGARWGTFLGTIDADHARQVGLAPNFGYTSKTHAFYCSILQMLLDEGF